jgi:hypothetical protein
MPSWCVKLPRKWRGSPETKRRQLEEHLAKAEGVERSLKFSLEPTVLAPRELARFLIGFNVETHSGRHRCRAQIIEPDAAYHGQLSL